MYIYVYMYIYMYIYIYIHKCLHIHTITHANYIKSTYLSIYLSIYVHIYGQGWGLPDSHFFFQLKETFERHNSDTPKSWPGGVGASDPHSRCKTDRDRIRPVNMPKKKRNIQKKRNIKIVFGHVNGWVLACRRVHFGMSTGVFWHGHGYNRAVLACRRAQLGMSTGARRFGTSTGAVCMSTGRLTIFHLSSMPSGHHHRRELYMVSSIRMLCSRVWNAMFHRTLQCFVALIYCENTWNVKMRTTDLGIPGVVRSFTMFDL